MDSKYSLEWYTYPYLIHDTRFQLVAITNTDSYWEELLAKSDDHPDVRDEKIPYWMEIWPCSIATATYIFENASAFTDKKVHELGCGMALSGLAAQRAGAQVSISDYISAAFDAAKLLWSANGQELPNHYIMDIRNPFKYLNFDIILASDMIYEKRMHLPLIQTFDQLLKDEGKVVLSEPQRKYSQDFFSLLEDAGYEWKKSILEFNFSGQSHAIAIYLIERNLRWKSQAKNQV